MSSDDSQIAKRAYEIWEREGRPHGQHHDHWHKAAAELAASKPAAMPKARLAPSKKKAVPATVKPAKKK
ncbi:hypothetical protein BH10PSE9_BH10PSE9_15230 [soil metagenome]